MNLKEAYNALTGVPTPKQAFLREIAEIAMVTDTTVMQWIIGAVRPGRKALQLLANHYQCSVEELGLLPEEDDSKQDKERE